MSISLQLLIGSAVFGIAILLLLGKARQKIMILGLLYSSILFFIGASYFLILEFSSYQKRNNQNGAREIDYETQLPEWMKRESEMKSLSSLRSYRDVWKGYEVYFLDMGRNGDMQVSYQQTLKDEIFSQMEKGEYGEQFWTKVFNLIFDYQENLKIYLNQEYETVFRIPVGDIHQDEEHDFGDLNIPENYTYFERVSQLEYLGQKLKFLDRSPEQILILWKQNKAYFYTFFPKNKYDRLCKKLVDDLISVHDAIVSTPFHQEFYSMYDVSDGDFLDFPSRSFTEKFTYSWPFSFWDRRFAENNAQEVFSILKEIQNHYRN